MQPPKIMYLKAGNCLRYNFEQNTKLYLGGLAGAHKNIYPLERNTSHLTGLHLAAEEMEAHFFNGYGRLIQ